MLSDLMGKRFGMRGRLWSSWTMQTLEGVFCILLGVMSSLGPSIVVMIVFSIFAQASCGLFFGIVPFISRRSFGVISGMTGARGNVGAVLTQLILFKGSRLIPSQIVVQTILLNPFLLGMTTAIHLLKSLVA